MSYLLKPLENCKLALHNRLVFPPMATSKSDINGKVSDALLEYYDEKSKSGSVSLFIIEHSFISQKGKASHGQLSVAEDSTIEGLKKLSADSSSKMALKVVMQINHAGSSTNKEVTGYEPAGPSAVINPRSKSNA